MFPIPASDVLTVKTNGINVQQARILNVTGQLMPVSFTATQSGMLQADVRDLPAGMYFLNMRTNLGSVTKMLSVVGK